MSAIAKLDPYQQKGMHIPVAIEWNQDTITIRPKLRFARFATILIVWMLIIVGVFAYATQNVFIVGTSIVCTGAVVTFILWATHAQATAGPYVVIDSAGRIVTFPRLLREIRYTELRRLTSGKRYETTDDSTIPYWFIDAEVLDEHECLWVLTLVATTNWWGFPRLERDLRRVIGSDNSPISQTDG
jgi:hypothetical protein